MTNRHSTPRAARPWLYHLPLPIGFVLLLCCGASGAWLILQQQQAYEWVRHTVAVQNALSEVEIEELKTGIDVRTSVLGRHAKSHLDARRSLGRLFAAIDRLQQLTLDNPAQQTRIRELRDLSEKRSAVLKAAMGQMEIGHFDEAAAVLTLPLPPTTVERFLLKSAEIRADESKLLSTRISRSHRMEKLAKLAIGASTLIALFLTLFIFHERRARMIALAAAKDRLEQDIKLRIAA